MLQRRQTQDKNNTHKGYKNKDKNKNIATIKQVISQSNILMAAPSATPRDCHLVQDPRKQTATAWSKEKASFKRIQYKTSEKLQSHVSKR